MSNNVPAQQMTADIAWGGDDTIYYITQDEALRPHKLWRHPIMEGEDSLLFTESDELFELCLYKSKSGKYLFASSDSMETSEVQFLEVANNESAVTVIEPREF